MRKYASIMMAVALLGMLTGADIYKWVDEQGVTHYSEKPPPGGKAKAVPLQPSTPSGANHAAPTTKTWQEQEQEFRQRRIERETAEKKQAEQEAAMKQQALARRERCIIAQQNLHAFQIQRPVYRINEKGERVFIDDNNRPAAIERAKKEVETYCEPRK